MSTANIGKASCLCNSVRIQFNAKEEIFDACHCGMCRKWSGGPLMTVKGGNDMQFEGVEFISYYNSSDWAERAFCKQCGTHLFYRLKKNQFCFLPLGIVENNERFKFHLQIFVDHKPNNYSFANETKMMTQAQVFEEAKKRNQITNN